MRLLRLLFIVVVVAGSLFVALPARAVEECYDFWEGRGDRLTASWYEFYVNRGEWQYVEFAPIIVNSYWYIRSDEANTASLSIITRWPYNITSVGVEIMSLGIQTVEVFARDRVGAVVRDTAINYISGNHIMNFDVSQAGVIEIKNTGFGVVAFVRVLVVCVDNLSTPTPQPTRTPTNAPTATPYTITPTPSKTPTQTRTLFPTVIGLGTLDSGPFRTAEAVSGECRDIRNPCPILPVAVFPTLDLASPTPAPTIVITQIVTSTPTTSPTGLYTPAAPTNTPIVPQISTLVDMGNLQIEFYDAKGTPVGAQTAYEMGSVMGGLFRLMRAVVTADLGPAGWIVSLMVGAIGIQIFFRVMLYFIPVFRVLVDIIIQILNVLIPG